VKIHSTVTRAKIKTNPILTGRSAAILCSYIGKPELYKPSLNEPEEWFNDMKLIALKQKNIINEKIERSL